MSVVECYIHLLLEIIQLFDVAKSHGPETTEGFSLTRVITQHRLHFKIINSAPVYSYSHWPISEKMFSTYTGYVKMSLKHHRRPTRTTVWSHRYYNNKSPPRSSLETYWDAI